MTPAAALILAHMWTAADGAVHDARWIEEHHPDCCGRYDCEVVQPPHIQFTPAGWRVNGFQTIVPQEQVRPSQDGKPWVCEVLGGFEVGERVIRCLFLPGVRG